MALKVIRPRRDEVRIGRGLPSGTNRPRLAEWTLEVMTLYRNYIDYCNFWLSTCREKQNYAFVVFC